MPTLSYRWDLCNHDPENYAGGSVANRSATHAGQVPQTKRDNLVLPVSGYGKRLITYPP